MTFSALWDCAVRPSTYDFYTWLVHVHALGASEIVFRCHEFSTRKWPAEEGRRRFENFIRPGPDLMGLPSRIGGDGRVCGSYMTHDLMADGGPKARLKSVFPAGPHKYTVTLRQTSHRPEKNSDDAVWREFARKIGAHVIEDTARKPIGLFERVALYAGAKGNFGVVNGPMGLLSLTPYPMTMFCDPETTAKGMAEHGVNVGESYGYCLPHQRMVWERPTVQGLMREFGRVG